MLFKDGLSCNENSRCHLDSPLARCSFGMPSHPWTLTRSLRRSFHCALGGPLWRPATARISAARTLCMRVSRFYSRFDGLGVCGCQPVRTLKPSICVCQAQNSKTWRPSGRVEEYRAITISVIEEQRPKAGLEESGSSLAPLPLRRGRILSGPIARALVFACNPLKPPSCPIRFALVS